MKKKGLIAAAMCVLSLAACTGSEVVKDREADAKRNAVLEVIASRKSVRSFTQQRVSEADVMAIVKAGLAAPSGRDIRPWELVVVDDRAVLDTLASRLPYAKMLAEAPLAVVVCGDTVASNMWVEDGSAVTENILLAVEALGLGAVWTAVYADPRKMESVSQVLGLPANVVPLNVIPIGYPNGEFAPKDKYDAAKVHRNVW